MLITTATLIMSTVMSLDEALGEGEGLGEGCSFLNNTNFVGHDVQPACNVQASSPQDCCDKCAANSSCVVWTFLGHNKCCFKSSPAGRMRFSAITSGCKFVNGVCPVPIPPPAPPPPPPPPPLLPCKSDMGCELNGECVNGACVCDKPWTGPTCGILWDNATYTPAYGADDPGSRNISSWGGGPPRFDPVTGTWHLFVTEIAGNCGMAAWSRMSQAVHAVSNSSEGPYHRVGVAIPSQSHNIYYAYSALDKMHLIYQIFDGASPATCNPYLKCVNGTTPGAKQGSILPPPGTPWPRGTCPPSRGTYVHYSESLEGPWMSAGALEFSTEGIPGGVCPGGPNGCSSNPSPYIFPNGTVLMLTRGTPEQAENIVLWRADSWNGTYHAVSSTGINGSTNMGDGHTPKEDPTLWLGRRGFHALLHSAEDLTHAWSEDGLTWSWSPTMMGPPAPPCGPCHNERPRVLLDENGDLDVIFVSQSTGVIDASRTASYRYSR